jgi:hypothetical protein
VARTSGAARACGEPYVCWLSAEAGAARGPLPHRGRAPHWAPAPAARCPPEAPVPAAGLISRSLSSIAASCGQSYRLQEFTPHPDLSRLEATAGASARSLERIRTRHPRWVYQGETLTQIAGASLEPLQACSLSGAARILQDPTS